MRALGSLLKTIWVIILPGTRCMARNMLRNGIEKFCRGPTRADLSFRPRPPPTPRLMNCAGAECQSWTVSTFTADTSHPIPSANTGDWTAGESDAVNATRRWTRRVHAKIYFFKNTYIFAFGLCGRLLEDGLHSLANAAPCAERQGTGTLRQHRLHCHVGKRTDG